MNEIQDENQRLRDEIARLKGEKGEPKILLASRPAGQDDDNEDGSQSNLKRGKGNKSLSDSQLKIGC